MDLRLSSLTTTRKKVRMVNKSKRCFFISWAGSDRTTDSCPLPHGQRGLSGRHGGGARPVIWVWGQPLTLCGDLQAHKTELLFTAEADNVFTLAFVMLHQHTTVRTGTDAGAASDPLHGHEDDVRTSSQQLQRLIGAVGVLTAICARSRAFPFPQTLPAEYVFSLSFSCADGAIDTQISEITPHHEALATRTRFDIQERFGGNSEHFLFELLHFFRG